MGWTFTANSDNQEDLSSKLKDFGGKFNDGVNSIYTTVSGMGGKGSWVGEDYDAFSKSVEGFKGSTDAMRDTILMFSTHFQTLSGKTTELADQLKPIIENILEGSGGGANGGANGGATNGGAGGENPGSLEDFTAKATEGGYPGVMSKEDFEQAKKDGKVSGSYEDYLNDKYEEQKRAYFDYKAKQGEISGVYTQDEFDALHADDKSDVAQYKNYEDYLTAMYGAAGAARLLDGYGFYNSDVNDNVETRTYTDGTSLEITKDNDKITKTVAYDKDHNPVQTTEYDDGKPVKTTTYEYDDEGNAWKQVTTGSGNTEYTRYYDPDGKEINPDKYANRERASAPINPGLRTGSQDGGEYVKRNNEYSGGTYKYYDENGNLVYRYTDENGNVVGYRVFGPDEVQDDGRIIGDGTWYDENGNITSKPSNDQWNAQLHPKLRTGAQDGGEYVSGNNEYSGGTYKYTDEDGNLVYRYTDEDGNVVGYKVYGPDEVQDDGRIIGDGTWYDVNGNIADKPSNDQWNAQSGGN